MTEQHEDTWDISGYVSGVRFVLRVGNTGEVYDSNGSRPHHRPREHRTRTGRDSAMPGAPLGGSDSPVSGAPSGWGSDSPGNRRDMTTPRNGSPTPWDRGAG